MNEILEIDRENLMVVVEPGVVTNEINDAIRDDGLFYAGYPMSLETCYIGGNVAENMYPLIGRRGRNPCTRLMSG